MIWKPVTSNAFGVIIGNFPSNLLTNPSFETGNLSGWSYGMPFPEDGIISAVRGTAPHGAFMLKMCCRTRDPRFINTVWASQQVFVDTTEDFRACVFVKPVQLVLTTPPPEGFSGIGAVSFFLKKDSRKYYRFSIIKEFSGKVTLNAGRQYDEYSDFYGEERDLDLHKWHILEIKSTPPYQVDFYFDNEPFYAVYRHPEMEILTFSLEYWCHHPDGGTVFLDFGYVEKA